jgi:Arc/MetJ-type ribon-helix-helix transcriptional regulator
MLNHKLSISLPLPLCEFVEDYQASHHCKTRSEVIAKALLLLRQQELEASYREASKEWNADFDAIDNDGLNDETW